MVKEKEGQQKHGQKPSRHGRGVILNHDEPEADILQSCYPAIHKNSPLCVHRG